MGDNLIFFICWQIRVVDHAQWNLAHRFSPCTASWCRDSLNLMNNDAEIQSVPRNPMQSTMYLLFFYSSVNLSIKNLYLILRVKMLILQSVPWMIALRITQSHEWWCISSPHATNDDTEIHFAPWKIWAGIHSTPGVTAQRFTPHQE